MTLRLLLQRLSSRARRSNRRRRKARSNCRLSSRALANNKKNRVKSASAPSLSSSPTPNPTFGYFEQVFFSPNRMKRGRRGKKVYTGTRCCPARALAPVPRRTTHSLPTDTTIQLPRERRDPTNQRSAMSLSTRTNQKAEAPTWATPPPCALIGL